MRTLCLLLLAVTLNPEALAGQRQVDERRPAARDASIKVFNLAGSTRVIGWDRDTIAVTGALSPRAGTFYLGVAGDGRSIRVSVDAPADERNPQGAALEVRVPKGARVLVRSATAYVEVSGITGGLDLYSVNGDISVSGTPREVYAEAMDGRVTVRGASPIVRAKTAGGAILLRVAGEEVDASTVSGDLVVEGGRYRRGRFQSVGGTIRFTGEFDRLGTYTFENLLGDIELNLFTTATADFEITTAQGAIENGFSRQRATRAQPDAPLILTFSTDPGSAQVSVRTLKGKIVLRKVPRA